MEQEHQKPFKVSRPAALDGYRIIDDHCHVTYHGYTAAGRGCEHGPARDRACLAADVGGAARRVRRRRPSLPVTERCRLALRRRRPRGGAVSRSLRCRLGHRPARPSAIDRLRAAVDTYGVRVYGELKLRLMYDDLDLIAMYRACGELGLPVLFHLEIELPKIGGRQLGGGPRPYWFGGEFDVLERVLAKCPDTTFIGHAPGFWREISGDAARREMYPKGPGGRGPATGPPRSVSEPLLRHECAVRPDGLVARSRVTRGFIERFQDRVLFGRDWWDDAQLHFLASLDLPDDVLRKVLAGNALRLVPLD